MGTRQSWSRRTSETGADATLMQAAARPAPLNGVPGKWHAAPWSAPWLSSIGSTSAQIGCAIGQRVRKRQPEGGSIGLGTSPVRTMRLLFRPGTGSGFAESRATRVRMERPREELVRRSDLDDPPEVHDRDAVGDVADDREVVRDEDVGEVELLLQLDEQVEDLGLDRDVERGDGLVGDDELRLQHERAREPDALPLPAAELVRVAVGRLGRHADALEHVVDDRPAALPPGDAVDREPLGDQVADLHARIERPHRVLEHDLHVPALLLQGAGAELEEVDAVERDLALGRLEQPQQRPPERRLPAARLAHEAHRLAAADVEVDAVDRLEVARRPAKEPLLDGEVLLQPARPEQDVALACGSGRRRVDRRAVHAHVAATGWTARGPLLQSQHADSCVPTSNRGGSSWLHRSKT